MNTFDYKKYVWVSGIVALLGVAFVSFAMGLVNLDLLKHPNGQVATITVTGEGEVTAVPDIATVIATIRETAKTVPEAQKAVEAKVSQALSQMESFGVDKKDIKTISYTVNPKYESQQIYCITVPCPQGKTIIVGYDVSETIQIKVRKIDSAGGVIGALGKTNITEISGPEFAVDNMDSAQAEAKTLAIKDAREKAKATAKSLGYRLGEITQFNENGGNYYPRAYGMEISAMKPGMDSVSLPQGESVIKSNVSVTYSLK
jgi:hypothetical protein